MSTNRTKSLAQQVPRGATPQVRAFCKYLKRMGEGGFKEAAERLGVNRRWLYEYYHGNADIPPKVAERIHQDTNGEIDKCLLIWGEDHKSHG